MVRIKYIGSYELNLPESIELDGVPSIEEVMKRLVSGCGLPEDYFWEWHFVLLNGGRPEMDDSVTDGDRLEIIMYSEGG